LWIEGDCGMIEQVVTNLCVNARDAMMPRGGRLTIATTLVTMNSTASKANALAKAGPFVRLTVADTGSGMDAETLKRIFEPFFTTKPVGKGTGLGLATVFGITKQHQGWIEVRSAINEGSTFTIFLPLICPSSVVSFPPIPASEPQNGTACILLVEDEQMVRQMVARTLQRAGYRILEASDGLSAIKLWAKHRMEIDLLFSDMVMPNELTGLDLARRFKAERPELKVVITSGYSVDIAQSGIPAGQDIAYLGKPYEVSQLTVFVRNCLRKDVAAGG
jgi:CheY-like chemotaxis protein